MDLNGVQDHVLYEGNRAGLLIMVFPTGLAFAAEAHTGAAAA